MTDNQQQPECVYIGGERFHVIDTNEDGTLHVRRPNGRKDYRARRLNDGLDFIYGERRARITHR